MTEDLTPTVEDNLTYIADDLTTLRDVVQRLRSSADLYERLASEGWELIGAVDRGRLYLGRAGLPAPEQEI